MLYGPLNGRPSAYEGVRCRVHLYRSNVWHRIDCGEEKAQTLIAAPCYSNVLRGENEREVNGWSTSRQSLLNSWWEGINLPHPIAVRLGVAPRGCPRGIAMYQCPRTKPPMKV